MRHATSRVSSGPRYSRSPNQRSGQRIRHTNMVDAGPRRVSGSSSSGIVHSAVSAVAFCQSSATADSPQRMTPISSCGHQPSSPRGSTNESREVHIPERVTKQQRLHSTSPSGLLQRAAERRQLEPKSGRPDQPRPLDHEPQQVQLSHILLTIRLALAEVLRPLKPRPGDQVPEPAHALLHETVAARRYPHPFFAVHLLEQMDGIADKHRLR